jgi:hypothetical protein
MESDYLSAYNLIINAFFPDEMQSVSQFQINERRFVHYTSAESALKILDNKTFWLRKTSLMNDFMEIQHGNDCIVAAFKTDSGQAFKSFLNKINSKTFDEFAKLYDSWFPSLKYGTYIGCLSEHDSKEDIFGRLSMWRAYGRGSGVAIVINASYLLREDSAFSITTAPVIYKSLDEFSESFLNSSKIIMEREDLLRKVDPNDLQSILFKVFCILLMCLKNKGFKEEREWRLLYTPEIDSSVLLDKKVQIIGGIPQFVYEIPFATPTEIDPDGISLEKLIDRIIIGPTEHALSIGEVFQGLLMKAGVSDPSKKVVYSGIPLRQ